MEPSPHVSDDLDRLTNAVQGISQGLVVHLSTYSVQNGNSQTEVLNVVRSHLEPSGIEIIAEVHADRRMMSLVLARNVPWAAAVESLPRSSFSGGADLKSEA